MAHAKIDDRYNDSTYLAEHRTWHAEDSPWKARQVARILARNGLAPRTVGEVGCGAGELLFSLKDQGIGSRLVGYEVSRDAFAICAPKATEDVKFHYADLTASEERFDLLLCVDVFEHVEGYIEFLRALRPRATHHVFHIPLDISVSAIFRGAMVRARRVYGHLHYFTRETALATLTGAGYEVVDQFYTAPFEKDGLTPKRLGGRIARLPRRIGFGIAPDLLAKTVGGCSLMVLAR